MDHISRFYVRVSFDVGQSLPLADDQRANVIP